MILCLETATDICSVALCDNSGIVAIRESGESRSHATQLTPFIEELFRETGISASALDAVAVSRGPGSYTGLRIGVSAAKGLAYSSSVPLIGIDTTFSMFHGIARLTEGEATGGKTLYCPMLDARRMEVYYAIYDSTGNIVKEISAEIIGEKSFSDIPESTRLVLFGSGAAKCSQVIGRKNILFNGNFRISASHMMIPALNSLKNKHFEDVAYFEPLYLKDFITSQPVKNILGR
jgi:tRNA threonylcarbamoyladenosine biosynthesis protein TsaB